MNLEKLNNRYSVKRFDPYQSVTAAQIDLLTDAFHRCPSSINIQPWQLVVVSNKEVKARLSAAGKHSNRERILECSHLLVLARKQVSFAHARQVVETTPIFLRLAKKMGRTTGQLAAYFFYYSRVNGGRVWMDHQLYLALGFLLAVCAEEGIGALPMEGIKPRTMDRVLGFDHSLRTRLALAVGVPHEEDGTNPSKGHKARLPKSDVVTVID